MKFAHFRHWLGTLIIGVELDQLFKDRKAAAKAIDEKDRKIQSLKSDIEYLDGMVSDKNRRLLKLEKEKENGRR